MKCNLEKIKYYTIGNDKLKAKIMNYGCTLLSLYVTTASGETLDVVLGYEEIKNYFNNPPCFGSCVLPNANRIENAVFSLNGEMYHLDKNDNKNNLHSGFEPLHKRLWATVSVDETSINFSIQCDDMDMGFPGNQTFDVRYSIEDNKLKIEYEGTSDKDTLFNPTNHSYFNLLGHGKCDILTHELIINADTFTPSDNASICHGEIVTVADTPMDFRESVQIGSRINVDFDQLVWGNGYDHNYVINESATKPSELRVPKSDRNITGHGAVPSVIPSATLTAPDKSLTLNIYTDAPCIQLYTGNYLSEQDIGKGNVKYGPRYGVALETQYAPNAINVDTFKKPILRKGETAHSTTVYEFT